MDTKAVFGLLLFLVALQLTYRPLGTHETHSDDLSNLGYTDITARTGRKLRATPKPISTNVTTDLVRVCVPIDLGLSADKCQSALAYATEATYKVSYSCIQGNSDYDCIAYVSTGAVDMAKLSGSGIYDGWKLKDLQPVVAEVVDGLPANVDSYSVALIDPTACIGDVKPSLKNLEDKFACFSEYGTPGGWDVPVGTLFQNGMPVYVNSTYYKADAQSVGNYFNKVCAPAVTGPGIGGKSYKQICDFCASGSNCDASDVWYDDLSYLCPGDVRFTYMPGGYEPAAETVNITVPGAAPKSPRPPKSPPPTEAIAPAPVAEAPKGDNNNNNNNADSPKAADTNTNVESPSPKPKKSPSPSPDANTASPDAPSPSPKKEKSPSPDTASPGRRLLQDVPLMLLCKDNTCKDTSQYQECNLAPIPASAFVSTKTFAKSDLGKRAAAALVQASTMDSGAFMTQSKIIGTDPHTLISKRASRLTLVDETPTQDYLGGDFIRAMDSFSKAMPVDGSSVSSTTSSSTSSDDDGGLSTAAIVGISIGAVLLVGFLATIGYITYYKRKRKVGWERYQDAIKEIQRL